MNKRLFFYLLCTILWLCQIAPAYSHEGPGQIIVEAQILEHANGEAITKMIFVEGHAHYPDGVNLEVGFKPTDEPNYIKWYKAIVKHQNFFVEMGPWTGDFASGEYVIEVWFIWEKQPPDIQETMLKSQDNSQYGVDKCRPEILKERKRCLSKDVRGACYFNIGTPVEMAMERESARDFLIGYINDLSSLITVLENNYNQTIEGIKKISTKNSDAGANKETKTEDKTSQNSQIASARTKLIKNWSDLNLAWIDKLNDLDDILTDWKKSKITVPYFKQYCDIRTVWLTMEKLPEIFQQHLIQELVKRVVPSKNIPKSDEPADKNEEEDMTPTVPDDSLPAVDASKDIPKVMIEQLRQTLQSILKVLKPN